MKIQSYGMKIVLCLLLFSSFAGCDYVDKLAKDSRKSMQYEKVALDLANENRNLKAEMNQLRYEIESLKAKNNYLSIQLKEQEGEKQERAIASLKKIIPKSDLVKFDVYRWTPNQILNIANKEFEQKNYEKSAQFFHSFAQNYPEHNKKDDLFLFQAGVAAYESGTHDQWVEKYLGDLIAKYPTSPYYRGAKLWLGLSYLRAKRHQEFFAIVEEFRKKYRNTDEWKIISAHYEEIVQKYKQ